jgi:hypothetical protein
MRTGIGDKDGKLTHLSKPEETAIKCTDCGLSIRATKRNVEAAAHASSKHPTKTFQELFPGATLPESLTDKGASEGGKGKPKLDIDRIRAEAAEAKSIAEGGVAKTEKKKKKKEDLSMLFAAAGISKK